MKYRILNDSGSYVYYIIYVCVRVCMYLILGRVKHLLKMDVHPNKNSYVGLDRHILNIIKGTHKIQ